jgi:hypothetical protein
VVGNGFQDAGLGKVGQGHGARLLADRRATQMLARGWNASRI